ncbi:MAG: glycosyltransferase family 4 protein [Verrucomicrobiota bacterium]|jgi:glycosyltransferase involved in cell wall biosynthesis
MKILVSQKGAREHFLAARALHRRGMLAHMVVDWYAPLGRAARFLGNSRWRALSRAFSTRTDELPDEMITALNFVGFKDRIRGQIAKRMGGRSEAILKGDIEYASAVARLPLPAHDVFFGYSYASLETMRKEKANGKTCVLDQIDPGEKEHEIIREEQSRWPKYVVRPDERIPRAVYDRLHEEWLLADIIIVNSEWSRQCNLEKGAPAEKMKVLPLAYEIRPREQESGRRYDLSQPVRILWVGRITLQKGIQYLIEAAKILVGTPVEFLIAGESAITKAAVCSAPKNIKWLGKITNLQKENLYSSSTVFVLPTLSDGFALTQLEAMAHGLPVITTPNCGRVVEEGKTGFIIPPCDPQALADAILRFLRHPSLAREMASACREAVKAFSVETYGKQLVEIIEKHSACR